MNRFNVMYLDWFYNFLTIEGFMEYYSLTRKQALYVIKEGKHENEENIKLLQEKS